MVASMQQNWNHMYSSHYKIIKYIGFEPIIYAIERERERERERGGGGGNVTLGASGYGKIKEKFFPSSAEEHRDQEGIRQNEFPRIIEVCFCSDGPAYQGV